MAERKVTNVGVAGATGRFGRLVLASLLEIPNIKARGLCRNASKLEDDYIKSSQLEVVEDDVLDQSVLSKFVDGLDVVICAYLGDNDFMVNGQKALIDACEQARVPRYIASDYTFDYTKLQLGEHPAKDPMKIVHEYLQGKQHVHGVHVLVGGFVETFWSGYFQVWSSKEKSLVYWGSGEDTWEVTTYTDAAKYTVAVALDAGVVGFQRFLGDRKSIREIAQALEKAYGFKPKLQREGSIDELFARMQELFAQDPSNVYEWLALFYQFHILNGRCHIAGALDNGKYPHIVPQTFEDFLNTHAVEDLAGSMEALGKLQ
ncbi:hypothetical protein MBLNU13_g10860t1 [Cladosporium sp. NU13]